jgi:hypothetical protein
MTLLRLVLGWAAVTAWFFLFELIEQRVVGPAPAAGRFRAGWKMYVIDALLFTLFAALWFASLGNGGWVLLFVMVGLVVEGPARLRDGSGTLDWSGKGMLRLAMGILRIVAAGGILAWRF